MGKLLVYLFKKLDKMDQMLQVQSTLIQGRFAFSIQYALKGRYADV